jgi:3',5'-nucleoside bisphosphate phosphatase
MSPNRPLLCELHAHTTWSDGQLEIRELVDVYGKAGFDVLAVTDHVVRDRVHVHRENFDVYLSEIEDEAERALSEHGLLVLPGLELTDDHPESERAAHALAIGVRGFVGLEDGLDAALRQAADEGALLIGAHPYPCGAARASHRGTARFAEHPEWAERAVHRFELVNRFDVFDWVRDRRLPPVATGDFHRLEHLLTWKTLVPCARDEPALVEYLRGPGPVELFRVGADDVSRDGRGRRAA